MSVHRLESKEVAHRKITNEIHLVKIASLVLKSNVPLTLGKLSSCSAPSDDSLPSSEQQGHTQTSFHSEEIFNGMWQLLIELLLLFLAIHFPHKMAGLYNGICHLDLFQVPRRDSFARFRGIMV